MVTPCIILFFQAFIGQKYGNRPLPRVIPAAEYETLMVTLKGHRSRETKSASLLDEWYTRDDNSVPPTYLLASLKEKFPDYFSVSTLDKCVYM